MVYCKETKEVQIREGKILLPSGIQDEVIVLNGEWEMYWNVLDDFQKIDNKGVAPIFVNIPSSWNSVNPGEPPSHGYASFRLLIQNATPGKKYYFKVKNQTTAYSFYADRNLLSTSGAVGRSEKEMVPQYRLSYVEYTARSQEIELIMTVSNYFHAKGGFRYPIEMGSYKSIIQRALFQAGFEFIVAGAILAMGFIHIFLYYIKGNKLQFLFFGLFCFLNALRVIVLDNFYITYFFPDLSWTFLVKMDYATTPLVAPLYLEYLRSAYPEEVRKKQTQLVLVPSLLISGFVLITPPSLFTTLLFLNNSIVGMAILIAFYSVLKINHYRRKDSRLILFGTLVLLLFGVHDLLAGSRIISNDLKFPIGLFIFFIIKVVMVARRNSYVFNHSQELKKELYNSSQYLEKMNREYSKYVPRQFVNMIRRKSILDIKLGDNLSTDMAILSSDIRDFTGFSENMSPEDNFKFLNAYLSRVTPYVSGNSGFIEKYIGDAIIALFPNGSQNAIDAGIQMQLAVNDYNIYRTKQGYENISIGVGIHKGESLVGVIGEGERLQTAAISESIYLTSIIEGLTKRYGAKILISVNALYASESFDKYPFRMVDSIKIVPEADPIGILEILLEGIDETSNLKIEYKDIFERGVYSFLEGDFQQASDLFEVIISQVDEDDAARIYYNRSQNFLKYGAPPGWESSSVYS